MKHMTWIGMVVLSACAQTEIAPLPQGTPVTIAQLLTETAATPYECTGFDARSDSCEAISTYTRSGDRVANAGMFLLSEEPRIKASGTVKLRIVGDRLCGDLGETDLSIEGMADPQAAAFVRDTAIAVLGQLGEICASYARLGEGHYVADYTTASGDPLPEAREELRFFARPKKLRAVE